MCNVHVPFYHHVTLDAALSNAHAQWITCYVQFIVLMRMSHFTTWSRHTLSGTVYCTNVLYQVALVSSIVIMRMCSLPSGAFAHAQLDHVAPSGHLAAQIFLLILSARWLKAKAEHRLYTHALMHIYYPQHTHTGPNRAYLGKWRKEFYFFVEKTMEHCSLFLHIILNETGGLPFFPFSYINTFCSSL